MNYLVLDLNVMAALLRIKLYLNYGNMKRNSNISNVEFYL